MAPDTLMRRDLPALIAATAEPLPPPEDDAFAEAADRLAKADIVLLGEASHGTSEFYRARAAITRRLIVRHGYTIVAVEADWPDAAQIDARLRHGTRPSAVAGPPFQRFPTWMWRNRETAELLAWMRSINRDRPANRQVGFYGLDLYSLSASSAAVLAYLDRTDPGTARQARQHYACLAGFRERPEHYGRLAQTEGFGRCEEAVLAVLRDLLDKQLEQMHQDGVAWFDAAQNARIVADAERYYRAMYWAGDESWNLRDTHMADTLDALLAWRPGARAVVWAHNSHIGDARRTDAGARGQLNLGQLMRERHPRRTRLVGFGTHSGTVAAASHWDGPMEIKAVLPSRSDSIERRFHDSGHERLWLDMTDLSPVAAEALSQPLLARFIGVIYRPETERWSHYYEVELAGQYDHYVFFDETRALAALPAPTPSGPDAEEPVPETFPFGL